MIIDPRFNGPPGTGNGGYVAGALAAQLPAGTPVTVRLSAPAPLGRELEVVAGTPAAGPRTATLRDGDQVIATAMTGASADLDALEVPAAVDLAAARAAAESFDLSTHPFPRCFVCGPQHPEGLHLYPVAPAGRRDVVAGPVTLPETTAPFVWAALDCPGAFAVGMAEGETLLLGTISASLDAPVPAGTELVSIGWSTGASGRKRTCGTALLDAEGTVLARAASTWISLDHH